MPTLLPNCPKYLSSDSYQRESPDSKRQRLEENAIRSAIEKSTADAKEYERKHTFNNTEELVKNLQLDKYWTVKEEVDCVMINRIISHPTPKLILSMVVHNDCSVHAYVEGIAVKRLGNDVVPSHLNDTNTLESILDRLRMFDKQNNSSPNVINVLQLVISLLTVLQDETYKHTNTLKFVCEQLHLITLDIFEYSANLLVFSSLLYNFSCRAYRFIREKSFLILPCYTTIRKVFISKQCSPEIEQHNNNFLSYIKGKAKALVASDKTVILMLDEIHLKPYLDYKS